MKLLKQETTEKRKAPAEDGSGEELCSEVEQKRLQKLLEEKNYELEKAYQCKQKDSSSAEIADLSLLKQEVIKRCLFEEVVPLFGEDVQSHVGSLKYVLEAMEFEADGDFTKGQINDFLRAGGELKKRQKICTLSDCNIKSKALEGDGHFSGDGVSAGVDTDKNPIVIKSKFGDCGLFEEDMILMFFMRLLNEWKLELEEMSSEFSRTSKGKLALARFKQCSKFLSPLVKLCTTYLLPDDVKKSLVSIVESCVQRDYHTAVGHWIKMVTENAPWPTVIRKPGIRKCDDEATRKYVLSVKHLMAFCQRKYPTYSSKSTKFNSLKEINDFQAPLMDVHSSVGCDNVSNERLSSMPAPM